MKTLDYLKSILDLQTFDNNSEEIQTIRKHRADVEALLQKQYSNRLNIKYGGSYRKKTMIRESYDIDIHCYFAHDDVQAGTTLKEIYDSVADTLGKKYKVDPKCTALRLRNPSPQALGEDFHIDVVPGRFIHEDSGNVNLHQESADKKYLKTNIEIQINHVLTSGLLDAIRLIKLWKIQNGIKAKTFILELLAVEILASEKQKNLDEQLVKFWMELRDNANCIIIKDPANPEGNDLTSSLEEDTNILRKVSSNTLDKISECGWENIFGSIDKLSASEKIFRINNILQVSTPSKPWGGI